VIAALRALHYDVAGVALPRALPALLNLVDISQLVYGSDYPFTPAPVVTYLATALRESPALDDAAKRALFSENALRLLPRFGRDDH
jgi:predicted TIM-barrel fold metal-dependent hydrolase